ncbi:MAG: hypothetical protein M1814_002058 [Vezdaea aestivalis]|nr:MAG: hypothetical protein M1814_002058 [Vezdaea aestivalis]
MDVDDPTSLANFMKFLKRTKGNISQASPKAEVVSSAVPRPARPSAASIEPLDDKPNSPPSLLRLVADHAETGSRATTTFEPPRPLSPPQISGTNKASVVPSVGSENDQSELGLHLSYGHILQSKLEIYRALEAIHGLALNEQVPTSPVVSHAVLMAYETGFTEFCNKKGITLVPNIDNTAYLHKQLKKYTATSLLEVKQASQKTPMPLEFKNMTELALEKPPLKTVSTNYPVLRESYKHGGPIRAADPTLAREAGSVEAKAVVFDSWPRPSARDGPVSRSRRAELRGLPANSAPNLVASLIHGGAIEKIHIEPRTGSAFVIFVDPDKCLQFLETTKNGVILREMTCSGGLSSIVYVRSSTTVDVMSSFTKECISKGATRCVRVLGIAPTKIFSREDLVKLAQEKGRKLQDVKLGLSNNGNQEIRFLFLNIDDAARFKEFLMHDVQWESYNIQFGEDP